MEISALDYRPARGKCGSNRERADVWGGAWRRSARRWELLAPLIASATGWRVWNPGRYGEPWHALFRGVYPLGVRPLLVFGLNPGPYGMAQTGVPFTDIKRLRERLPNLAGQIRRRGGRLEVPGLAPPSLRAFLTRSFESSAVRVYRFLELGWGSAEKGWKRVAVANSCSLRFMDPVDGGNRTPADLRPAASRRKGDVLAARKLQEECDRLRRLAAQEAIEAVHPRGVILLGKDVQKALRDMLIRRLGREAVLGWEHPARAVPERWAGDLLDELRKRRWR